MLAGLATSVGALVLPRLLWASDPAAAPIMSPDHALQLLKEGHARFLAGKSERPNLTPQRIAETFTNGQQSRAKLGVQRLPPLYD